MGYGNYNKDVGRNKLLDPFYYCGRCWEFNDPFWYYGNDFEAQKKENVCKSCKEKMDKKELYEK